MKSATTSFRNIAFLNIAFLALLVAFSAALIGCGGGGGGGTSGLGTPGVSTGVIAGKGSIIVNGVEFEMPKDPGAMMIDDVPHPEDDFKIGMAVEVEGMFDDKSHGRANRIRVEAIVKGKATVTGAATFTVLGQTVTVTATTIFDNTTATFSNITPLDNAFVEVHGLFTGPNTIQATLIKVEFPNQLNELKGVIGNLTGSTFTIGTQLVNYSGATVLPTGTTLRNGDFVQVKGTMSGSTLMATRVKKEDLGREFESQEVEVKGAIVSDNVAAKTFVLLGPHGLVTVHWDNNSAGLNTKFEGGDPSGLHAPARVEVEGTMQNGILQATEIEFEDEVEVENNIRIQGDISGTPSGGTFTLLGIPIHTSGATVFLPMGKTFADLAAGTHVEVHGAADGLGGVNAARVVILGPSSVTILQEPVTAHDTGPNPRNLTILGITVDTATTAQFRNAAHNLIGRATFFGSITNNVTIVQAKAKLAGAFNPATKTLAADDSAEIEPHP